jgi:hypothetical protein
VVAERDVVEVSGQPQLRETRQQGVQRDPRFGCGQGSSGAFVDAVPEG